jgi:Arc/MetJ family transcription regulator
VYKEVYEMRTNIVLDDDLVARAFKVSGAKTKKGLINEALEELIAARQRLDIRNLKGKIGFREDYYYKKMRKGH